MTAKVPHYPAAGTGRRTASVACEAGDNASNCAAMALRYHVCHVYLIRFLLASVG
jgi:hypothetical protein